MGRQISLLRASPVANLCFVRLWGASWIFVAAQMERMSFGGVLGKEGGRLGSIFVFAMCCSVLGRTWFKTIW